MDNQLHFEQPSVPQRPLEDKLVEMIEFVKQFNKKTIPIQKISLINQLQTRKVQRNADGSNINIGNNDTRMEDAEIDEPPTSDSCLMEEITHADSEIPT
ncbi:unnamed protein product [Malus baccata var. baccata]